MSIVEETIAETNANVKLDHPNSHESNLELCAEADEYWTTRRNGAVKLRFGETQFDGQPPCTLVEVFEDTVAKVPQRVALAVKREGEWRKWTYAQYYETSKTVAKAFVKLGLERFSSVGILGFNAPEWIFSNMGAIFAGGLSLGIYTTNLPSACQYVAQDGHAQIIVVENTTQLSKILEVWQNLPDLKAVVQYTGEVEDKSNPNIYDWESLMKLGESCDDKELNERMSSIKANQCCSLIYTSGTTGAPKGVMLSHDNVTYTSKVVKRSLNLQFGQEIYLSFLPLSHLAAQNGFLHITGRIKEIIITAGGENIAPVPIEGKIKAELPIVSNAMLIGDKRKFVSCMLTLKVVTSLETGEPTDELLEIAKDFCKQHGCDATKVSEILNQKPEKLMKAIQDGIDKYNESAISRAQKIQKWFILERDFSIPGGELGPTMKMRRPIILKMYEEKINALYE